jgi:signal transduction histidine kinase
MFNILKLLAPTLKSYAFRYFSRATLTASVLIFFMLVTLYGIFSYQFFHSIHNNLSEELDRIVTVYYEGGIDAVDKYIDNKESDFTVERFGYLLADEKLNKLAGGLDEWPEFAQFGDGWLSFEIDILTSKSKLSGHKYVARTMQLSNGDQMLIAQNYQHIEQTIKFVFGILLNGFFLSVVVGLFGSFYLSWTFLSRLGRINKSVDNIINGDLSERISVEGQETEIDQLVDHLNIMLDRIGELMDGVKQVSDNIAHDLRTPLTRLRNKLATFERHCREQDQDVVSELIEEADNLFATFNALLRIARIELGESVQRDKIDLQHLVGEVIDLYEPLASEKHIDLQLELSAATIDGDRNLIFQAVANVLDNAVKYTPDNGVIKICLSVQSNVQRDVSKARNVQLEISDSGCGINESNHDKVFRRFYREESSRSCLPGNGLGLSLVSAVMKIHAADISMRNNSPSGLIVSMSFYPSRDAIEINKSLDYSESSRRDNREISTSAS